MQISCSSRFEFKRKDTESPADVDNWVGLVHELTDWLNALPDTAIVDIGYPINLGTNYIYARWTEER